MNTTAIILVTALLAMIEEYNNGTGNTNYIDLRDFQAYIESKGINIEDVKEEISLGTVKIK